jgi:hypothetical protein
VRARTFSRVTWAFIGGQHGNRSSEGICRGDQMNEGAAPQSVHRIGEDHAIQGTPAGHTMQHVSNRPS